MLAITEDDTLIELLQWNCMKWGACSQCDVNWHRQQPLVLVIDDDCDWHFVDKM